MDRFANKIAVVTGSSSGIGAVVSKELVKHHMIVVGIARRIQKLQSLAQEISSDGKCTGRFYPLQCDVTKETDIENAFKWITTELGPIAILINNAGVLGNTTILETEVNAESITKVFDTNVKAAILCSKAAIKNMNENSTAGHIINVNSVAGHVVWKKYPIYGSSKHALKVISETFRQELVRENSMIKVTNLSPGCVLTEMTHWVSPASHPPGKFIYPQHIADACISILSTPPNVLISELTIMPIHQDV